MVDFEVSYIMMMFLDEIIFGYADEGFVVNLIIHDGIGQGFWII